MRLPQFRTEDGSNRTETSVASHFFPDRSRFESAKKVAKNSLCWAQRTHSQPTAIVTLVELQI